LVKNSAYFGLYRQRLLENRRPTKIFQVVCPGSWYTRVKI